MNIKLENDNTPKLPFSKKLINDIRYLLWIITISSIILAFYCIKLGYLGTLPWIAALVGLPWSAHGVVCSFYLNMSKSDHQKNGITYELAMRDLDAAAADKTTIPSVVVTDEPTI